jgi:hypothetical protein
MSLVRLFCVLARDNTIKEIRKMKAKIQSKSGHKIIHLTRRKAIRERCLNCSGWSFKDVESCPIKNCQLYPYRMGSGQQDAQARYKAIRRYCLWCSGNNRAELNNCPARDCPLWYYRKGRLEKTLETLFLSEKLRIGAVSKVN